MKNNLKREGAYFVYMVECKYGTYYTGYTNDLEKRIKEHNSGKRGAKYLKGKGPVRLVYAKEYRYYRNAVRAERDIKKRTRKEKEAMIKTYAKSTDKLAPQISPLSASKSIRGADNQKFFIKTFGCQMNEHDSERVRDMLAQKGYGLAEGIEDADVIIFNTCSVREHAEDRVYGKVGTLRKLKVSCPGLIIGIIGCMAEARKNEIFERLPHVDFLCGPAGLDRIPDIIDKIRKGAGRIVYVEGSKSKKIPEFSRERNAGHAGFVKIMEGCNNFCSYCIVPYVRGPERSRPRNEILDEVRGLIAKGAKNITLLGQNVNSYGKGLKEKIDFVSLLRSIDKIAKGAKINFVTSHPKDACLELFKAMRDLKSVSKSLHLPVQSGSDKILKKMNRRYIAEKYRKLVKDFRQIVKNGTISTDIIVGFPGETEKDFEDTLKLVKEMQFDAAYIFKYSARPFTKASSFKDTVSLEEKERRHQILLKMQKSIARKSQYTIYKLQTSSNSK